MSTNQVVSNNSSESYSELSRKRFDSLDLMFDFEQQRLKRLNRLLAKSPPLQGGRKAIFPIERPNTLNALLDRLKSFSNSHFQFFYSGFSGNASYSLSLKDQRGSDNSEPLPEGLVSHYALSTILSKISSDLDVLARINDQRFSNVTENLKIAERLRIADKLAIGAILAVDGTFWDTPNSTTITYFRTDTNVRIVPYLPVALIGIPLTGLGSNQDLLAIPHEVGHYYYWKSSITIDGKQQQLHSSNKNLLLKNRENDGNVDSMWIYEWEEEIFADILGCLIGGPAMLSGLFERLQNQTNDLFVANNGVHPISAIRPYVLLHIVEKYLKDKDSLNKYSELWMKILEDREINLNTKWEKVQGKSKRLKYWKTTLLDMVDVLMEHVVLPNHQALQRIVGSPLRWPNEFTDDSLESLLETISHTYGKAVLWDPEFEPVPNNSTQKTPDQSWLNALADTGLPDLETNKDWWDKDNKAIKENAVIPRKEWQKILKFGGWTTEGPGPKHVGDSEGT